jgi:hypothetical protein
MTVDRTGAAEEAARENPVIPPTVRIDITD